MPRIRPFEEYRAQYESWFEDNFHAYQCELRAVARLLPEAGNGLEIGVGSGRFAGPLGVGVGVEPSPAMQELAEARGIEVHDGVAERLPFPSGSFDYALMVTTICFVDDLEASFLEAARVLRKGGMLVVGFVDRASRLGRTYEANRSENVFYRDATFYSAEEVLSVLAKCGFREAQAVQTVFGVLSEIRTVQEPRKGYGEGGFVVIAATGRAESCPAPGR